MSATASAALPTSVTPFESAAREHIDHYERACDQAIAMCDGNLRSTIKALIMANEYLESELHELQTTTCGHAAPSELPGNGDTA